jgi:cytochrome c-type biogenesis protein CcmH/NrfG
LDAYHQALKLDPTQVGVHLQIAVPLLTHASDADAWQQALTDLQQEVIGKFTPAYSI